MNFDFTKLCLQNKISSLAVPKISGTISKQQFPEDLRIIELDKDLLQTQPSDFETVQLIWLECPLELNQNFSHVVEHVLNLGITWIWIPNLRFSDFSRTNILFNPKRQNEAVISFKDMIQLMEKSMYSIHWSASTYEESVKNLLLKEY